MFESRHPRTADLAGVLASAAQEQVQPPRPMSLSMRDIFGVLTVLAILAGGAGLSWLAWNLPTPTLLRTADIAQR
jgi:hypothetical protein